MSITSAYIKIEQQPDRTKYSVTIYFQVEEIYMENLKRKRKENVLKFVSFPSKTCFKFIN